MPQLYAITTVYNPAGYESRFRLYREFAKRIEKSGVALYTVELATGDQDFAVTDAEDPRHIRLRSPHTLWYKENLINIAIARLPRDWEYVAWLDADIQFLRPDWVTQTEQTDQDAVSTGCSIVYIYWMRSLGYTIPQIVQAAGPTLSANYQALTGQRSAYQDLLAAMSGLSVTSDNPFYSNRTS